MELPRLRMRALQLADPGCGVPANSYLGRKTGRLTWRNLDHDNIRGHQTAVIEKALQ